MDAKMGQEKMTPENVLKRYWGFDSLRDFQRGPVHDLASGRSVLAVLPTGGGKTICYQVPALVRGGLCLVVSPLIALMKDQIHGLRQRGIRADLLSSEGGKSEMERVLENAAVGALSFLYVSPERLVHEMFLARLPRLNVQTVAIDEAHCISQWGHDFRPAYRKIKQFLSRVPGAVVGAFTATATAAVFEDIAVQLGLQAASHHRSPMRRPNLGYGVVRSGSGESELIAAAMAQSGSGLVYVGTRIQAELWAKRLQLAGLQASAYHAGLPPREKSQRQKDWIDGKLQVMACTSAFGMGIDKPDVRWVFHAHLPADLESYVQEAGRAGRDGQPSICWVFPTSRAESDTATRLKDAFPPIDLIQSVYQGLANVSRAAIGELPEGEFSFDLTSWALKNSASARQARSALQLIQSAGHITIRESEVRKGKVKLLLTPSQARETLNQLSAEKALLETLLRAPERELELEPEVWAKSFHLPEDVVREWLVSWDRRGWIEWKPEGEPQGFRWLQPRQRSETFALPKELYTHLQAIRSSKWSDLLSYLNESGCRSLAIDRYFGDASEDSAPCGRCDNCRAADMDWQLWLKTHLPKSGMDGFELLALCPLDLRLQLTNWLAEARTQGWISSEGRKVYRHFD